MICFSQRVIVLTYKHNVLTCSLLWSYIQLLQAVISLNKENFFTNFWIYCISLFGAICWYCWNHK